MSNDDTNRNVDRRGLGFFDQTSNYADDYLDAVCNGISIDEDDEECPNCFVIGVQAGCEWARSQATPLELTRAAWLARLLGLPREESWCYPTSSQFVFAINPDVVTDEHSADRRWREMLDGLESIRRAGYDLDSDYEHGRRDFESGAMLGAATVGLRNTRLSELPPCCDESQQWGNTIDSERGTHSGAVWASTHASEEELHGLFRLARLFSEPSDWDHLMDDGNGEAIVRLLVFLMPPSTPDAMSTYREIWTRMVGHGVPNPWTSRFVVSFVQGAVEVARQQLPDQTPEANEPPAVTGSRSGSVDRAPRRIRIRRGADPDIESDGNTEAS